ncbi:unnamed protein product [Urochloa humidicola]
MSIAVQHRSSFLLIWPKPSIAPTDTSSSTTPHPTPHPVQHRAHRQPPRRRHGVISLFFSNILEGIRHEGGQIQGRRQGRCQVSSARAASLGHQVLAIFSKPWSPVGILMFCSLPSSSISGHSYKYKLSY